VFGFLKLLVRSALYGHGCDRCGRFPAKLVIDGVVAGKRIDGRARTVTKTIQVRSAEFLCADCRKP
jgi:hypothetical protein